MKLPEYRYYQREELIELGFSRLSYFNRYGVQPSNDVLVLYDKDNDLPNYMIFKEDKRSGITEQSYFPSEKFEDKSEIIKFLLKLCTNQWFTTKLKKYIAEDIEMILLDKDIIKG